MKKLKLALCFAFIVTFGAFELLHSNAVTGQTGGSALSAPTGVIASDSKFNNKVTVMWDTIRGATSYRVFRNTTNNPATASDLGVTVTNSFFDGGATPGQTFFYWVRAENSSTASDMSTPDQGTRTNTPGPPPPGSAPPLNPPPPAPLGNDLTATKIYLGKALFWDEQLSSTRTVSCGTCHHSGNGGTDPRSVTAVGTASTNPGPNGVYDAGPNPDDIRGSSGVPNNNPDGTYLSVPNYGLNDQVTGRKTVSYVNAAYPQVLFWDGRATGTFTDPISGSILLNGGAALESQVLGPPVSTAEMGHNGRNWNDVAARISGSTPLALSPSIPAPLNTWINGRTYSELFLEAFGTNEVTPSRIAMAIASFERSLYTDQAPVDLDAQNITPLSAAAQRGRGVFNGSSCNVCHAGPLFSDNSFRDIGVRPANEDTGRFQVTGNPQNIGEFRVPSLRNVALRGSFFHNGQFTTLAQVVAFYNRGGDNRNDPNVPRNLIRPLGLSQGQQNDLIAFLQSMTDPRLLTESAPFDRPALYMESNRVPLVTATGTQRVGSGGIAPQIKSISPPIIGNPNFTVSLSGAVGNGTAALVISERDPGATATTIPNTRSLFGRIVVTAANTGAGNGWASVSVAIPNDVAFIGRTYTARWYVQDPGAVNGLAISKPMRFTIFGPAGIPGDALPSDAIFSTDRELLTKDR